MTATALRPVTASRSRARRLLALTLATPLLAACSVNFGAQTDQVYTPAQGVNDRSTDIDVLNALVVAESDGSGRLIAGLASQADEDVELTGVQGVDEDAEVQFGSDGGDAVVPAGGFLQLADEGSAVISATGEGVEIGDYVRLTMSFSNGDEVSVNVPVVVPGEDFADVTLPSSSASPSGSSSEEPTSEPSESPSSEG